MLLSTAGPFESPGELGKTLVPGPHPERFSFNDSEVRLGLLVFLGFCYSVRIKRHPSGKSGRLKVKKPDDGSDQLCDYYGPLGQDCLSKGTPGWLTRLSACLRLTS